jgi:hypothetical protein
MQGWCDATMNVLPKGFHTLMCAQFFSATADNALLIVAISHLHQMGDAGWNIPLLKWGFALAYVGLAPWVGVLSDAISKSSVMWFSHALKLTGVLGMVSGVDTVWAYAWVGVGAALYSPAKYGWVSQMVPSAQLVKANGWIETSTVLAALAGVVCGGWWISPGFAGLLSSTGLMRPEANGLVPAHLIIAGLYMLTVGMTWTIPKAPMQDIDAGHWIQRPLAFCMHDVRSLWRDRQARASLGVTTLFWGVGACMQLLVLDWCETSLGLSLEQAAYMQGISVVGVIAGAWWAGRTVTLDNHRKALKSGLVMAGLLPLMVLIHDWPWAVPMIMVLGFAGGYLVVPMNAMLQHRGVQVLTAGRSIAVQNFNENLSILVMLSVYALVIQSGGAWWIMTLGSAALMTCVCGGLMTHRFGDATGPAPSSGDPPLATRGAVHTQGERS